MSSLSPDPFPCFSFRRCVHAFAVLFSILPIPCINLSTGPRKFPHSMFFVFIVFTYIGFTIRPCEGTPPVHHVLFPLSPILSLVFPHINSDSIYGIIFEITHVTSIWTRKLIDWKVVSYVIPFREITSWKQFHKCAAIFLDDRHIDVHMLPGYFCI